MSATAAALATDHRDSQSVMRVLIADHQDLYRDAATAAIARTFPAASVAQISGPEELRSAIQTDATTYELVIAALDMPSLSFKDLGLLAKKHPNTPLVLITGKVRPSLLRSMVLHGVGGVIPRAASSDYFIEAVRFALVGGFGVPRDYVSADDAPDLALRKTESEWIVRLTAREREVLDRLCAGLSNKLIALELKLSPVTVKLHVRSILRKMRVKTRSEAAATAALARLC